MYKEKTIIWKTALIVNRYSKHLYEQWLSIDICRFCLYPQELVLLMREPIRLRKLQLLSHQFMICKCSFFVGWFGLWIFNVLTLCEEEEVFFNHKGSSNAGILTFFLPHMAFYLFIYTRVGNCPRFHSNWSSEIIPLAQPIDHILIHVITAEKFLRISIYFVLCFSGNM